MKRTHTEIMNLLRFGSDMTDSHKLVFFYIENADIGYETKMKFRGVFIANKDLDDIESRYLELTEEERETLLLIIEKSWGGKIWHEAWVTAALEKAAEINRRLCRVIGDTRENQYIQLSNFGQGTGKVQLGVNWTTYGTSDSRVAAEYAKAIVEAAEYAEHFKYNGMEEFY